MTDWVQKFRGKHEVDSEWRLRKAFLTANRQKFDETRLVSLSNCYSHSTKHGSVYPPGVMYILQECKHDTDTYLTMMDENPVEADQIFFQRRIQKMKYYDEKVELQDLDSKPAPKKIKHSESGRSHFPFSNADSEILKSIIIWKVDNPVETYSVTMSKNRVDHEVCQTDEATTGFKTTVTVKGIKIYEVVENTKKDSERLAKQFAMERLAQICFSIVPQFNKSIAGNVNVEKGDISKTKSQEAITESNVGRKLLKKMGWRESKDDQNVIESHLKVSRTGLGFDGSNEEIPPDFEIKMNAMLSEYAIKSTQTELLFSSEFSKEERKIIHLIAKKLGLKSKSKSEGDDERYLRVFPVWKSLSSLLTHIIETGDHPHYKVVHPTSF